MNKILKGVLIFFGIVFLLGLMGGDSPEHENTNEAISTSAALDEKASPDLAEQIRKEIAKKIVAEPNVVYNEHYKTLVVELHKERSMGPESFRRDMFLGTMTTMDVAVKHRDAIDEITISGWTNMVDTKGNSASTKVYQADRSMSGADTVNWDNLINYPDMMAAIENNFDTVYWHPAVRK